MKESINVDGVFQPVTIGITSEINALSNMTGEVLLSNPTATTEVKIDPDFSTRQYLIVDSDAEVTACKASSTHESFIDARNMLRWNWAGATWVSNPAGNYIRPGRHYYNKVNGKVFFYNPDTLTLVHIASIGSAFATNQQVIDGTAGDLLINPAALKALYTSLHPA
jgi:hypothetical protein